MKREFYDKGTSFQPVLIALFCLSPEHERSRSAATEADAKRASRKPSVDILAVESKSKSFVVIELKKGRPSDCVVGQILRYMGWVKQNLCSDGQAVKADGKTAFPVLIGGTFRRMSRQSCDQV
jgi:hypothetical protein